jgi:hypothetical protein
LWISSINSIVFSCHRDLLIIVYSFSYCPSYGYSKYIKSTNENKVCDEKRGMQREIVRE